MSFWHLTILTVFVFSWSPDSAACKTTIFNDTDVKGEDLEQVPAVSAEHCQHLCTSHPLCSYFSFHKYVREDRGLLGRIIFTIRGRNLKVGLHRCTQDWYFVLYSEIRHYLMQVILRCCV